MEYTDLCYLNKEFKKLEDKLHGIEQMLTGFLGVQVPDKQCSFEGCLETAVAKGLCKNHYKKIYQ